MEKLSFVPSQLRVCIPFFASSGGGVFLRAHFERWGLLRQVDKRINLLERVAECFTDGRAAERVEHTVAEMPGAGL
jgi:hypothetical protein